MNAIRTSLIAAAALTALSAAVHADDLQAFHGEDSGSFYLSNVRPSSELTRTQIVAGVQAERADGTLGSMTGEDSGSFLLAKVQPAGGPTRAQIVAGVHAARADGTLGSMTGEDSGSFAWSHQNTAIVVARAR